MINLKNLIFYCLSLIGILFSQYSLDLNRKANSKPLISPPPYLQYYTLGYNEIVSDVMWLRVIQDLDYCEEKVNLNIFDNTVPCAGNSWLFNMLDTVTNISPNFRMPFAIGGVALKYLVGDNVNASKFYNKAVERFPKDWRILFSAAHHAMDVEKDLVKAAELLKRSADNGGAEWYYTLAAKLYSQSGQKEFGLYLYEQLKQAGILSDSMLEKMKKNLELNE